MQVYILHNTEKHVFGTAYDKRKSLSLVGAKGERVAFQAIVADKCKNVTVKAESELSTEIFFEKYLPLKVASGPNAVKAESLVPDPLVDEKRATKFGDNSSERGELLIWCFADIPCDAEKTHYTVKLTVTADEGQDTVGASISVMDFCMPSASGNVTSFLTRDDMINADSDDERLRKNDELIELGLKYGCSPTRIVPIGVLDFDKIIARMKKHTQDKRCTAYSVPYKVKRETDPVTGKDLECLDVAYLKELFLEMAKVSTDECDLFAKANVYVGFTDEPVPENFFRVRRVYREIHDIKREVAKEHDFSDKRGVEYSLLTMDNIVTVFDKEPIYGEVDTWCPTFWAYHKPEYIYEEKKLRGLGKKNWWYGCVAPWTPIPNLHIDSPMKDSRFESWLRYKFDIKGMLYWATNLTKKYADGKYTPCDLFEEPMLFSGANGDGLLFYTETQYGEPLPGLRLMSMYLGFQEYEYFTLLDKAAKGALGVYGKAFDTRKMLKPVFDRLAAGVMLVYPFDTEYLRLQVGQRVELAKRNVFVDSEVYSDGCNVTVYSPSGDISVNGKKGKRTVCGNGFGQTFSFVGSDMLEIEILLSGGNTKKLLIAERRVPLAITKVESNSGKVSVCSVGEKIFVHADEFVNEEEPRLFIPLKKPATGARTVELDIETLSGDAFILNTVLVDEAGNKYHAGYAVAEEKAVRRLSVSVTEVTQNRLNCVDDVEPIKFKERNRLACESFRFDRIVGVEILLANNIKLLDENRERRKSSYDFMIIDGFVNLV